MINRTKKRIAFALMASSLTGSLAVTSAQRARAQNAPAMQRFTDSANHYFVDVPAGWKHGRDGTKDFFIGPLDGKMAPNIAFFSAHVGPVSPEQAFKSDLEGMHLGMSKFKGATVTPAVETTIGGKPAQTMLMQVTSQGIPVEQRHFVCLHDQVATAVSITYPAGQSAKYNPLINRILSGLKWEK